MKQAVGSTWTFSLVVTFVLLFAAFILLTLNYSAVFRHQAEIISIIEKYEGFTLTAKQIIDSHLKNNGYLTTDICPDDYFAATIDENKEISREGNYCINRVDDYYEIMIFFNFNIPVLGEIFTFKITGETKEILIYEESNNLIE